MNLHLNHGDPCWVRIHTGEIVRAKYIRKSLVWHVWSKIHLVDIDGSKYLTGRWVDEFTVRFVLMPNNTEK